MLNFNHPDDERLSALAFRDTDASTDTSLTAHVSSCDRCTDLVNELGALRASLAELPDIQPSRPLRVLPEVAGVVQKVEGLGLLELLDDGVRLLAVVDADDPTQPSRELVLRVRWS